MQNTTNKRALVLLAILAMTTIISGCNTKSASNSSTTHRTCSNNPAPRIEIVLLDGDLDQPPADNGPIERTWASSNTWRPKLNHDRISFQLYFTQQKSDDKQPRHYHSLHYTCDNVNITGPYSQQDSEPVSVSIESKMGRLDFVGQLGKTKSWVFKNDVKSYGTVIIDLNQVEIEKIEEAFGQLPSVKDTIALIMQNTDPQEIVAYADCKVQFDITQAIRLAAYNLTAADINQLIDNGYNFSAKEILKLSQYYVSPDYMLEWKNAGYSLSAEKLIYAKQRYLSASMAKQWKDAGYDVDLEKVYWIKQRYLDPQKALDWKQVGYELNFEQLYWVKQRYLDPQKTLAWKQAGYELNLEQLYWIKQRYLKPQNAAKWKNAGYDLDLEDLYWVKQRYLKPDQAKKWKDAGYNLSLKELYKLKQYHVGSDYGVAFADPDYEPLTVDELIKFKQSNISTETVNKLRKRKQTP